MQDGHDSASPQLPGWHHVPQVPIEVSPFFGEGLNNGVFAAYGLTTAARRHSVSRFETAFTAGLPPFA